MALYTFHMCDPEGFSACFETRELPHEITAFSVAGDLLQEHPSADHIAVWEDDRPVLTRHRDGPVILGSIQLNRPPPRPGGHARPVG